jgi:hypothetical protein
MSTDTPQGDLVRSLIRSKLSAVTFVRGYVQFSFEGAGGTHVLSAYNDPVVSDGREPIRRGDLGWKGALVALINKSVSRAATDNGEIAIAFDAVTVSIDVEGDNVEAAMLTLGSCAWDMWRPSDIQPG